MPEVKSAASEMARRGALSIDGSTGAKSVAASPKSPILIRFSWSAQREGVELRSVRGRNPQGESVNDCAPISKLDGLRSLWTIPSLVMCDSASRI